MAYKPAVTFLASILLLFPMLMAPSCGEPIDNDGDGYPVPEDCDDTDPSIHPDQEEPCVCDGIDQNCNDIVDDFPCDMTCPEDADGDGYTSDVDCDDTDATIHPDQEEPCVCDGIDQNCNAVVDDFPCDLACPVDADGDGYTSDVDCDDTDATIHPDQEEPCVCDGIDQNCNGSIDDFPCDMTCPSDVDGDGYTSDVDCDDTDPTVHPDQEEPCICDDIDQNCNGSLDDYPCDFFCAHDADGDGYDTTVDCNDSDASIHPGQEEPCTCDAIDQNCNGTVDDFPCDRPACTYQQEGEVCNSEPEQVCEPGLVCCYPCGVEGCNNVCQQPCYDEWCSGGCPLVP